MPPTSMPPTSMPPTSVPPTSVPPAPWDRGHWLNPPPDIAVDGADLLVRAREGSDFWRHTAYGFVHDDGHALLDELLVGSAVEVTFVAAFDAQFDQAGVLVRADERTWIKAGIEYSDGHPQLGAVVTHGLSDWSVAPVDDWAGHPVTVRASRGPDALTVRARRGDGEWRLIRVAPLAGDLAVSAGPFCCAPTRSGLQVRFTGWRVTAADAQLHAGDGPQDQ